MSESPGREIVRGFFIHVRYHEAPFLATWGANA